MNRKLFAAVLVAGMPGIAAAQFTTFIAPQHKVADSVRAVVAVQQQIHADSIIDTHLTDIKTWVDSAAGALPRTPSAAADSLTGATSPAQQGPTGRAAAQTATASADTTRMRNGARAPATASALPMLLLLGIGAMGLGVFLLAGHREPALARTRA